jgi:hypothetical protein
MPIKAVRVFILDWRVAHMLLFYATRITRARRDRALTVLAVVTMPVGGDRGNVFAVNAVNDANGIGKSSEHWLLTN